MRLQLHWCDPQNSAIVTIETPPLYQNYTNGTQKHSFLLLCRVLSLYLYHQIHKYIWGALGLAIFNQERVALCCPCSIQHFSPSLEGSAVD